MIIGSIKKNDGDLVVACNEFKGKVLVHIRLFSVTVSGELRPTFKGVTVLPEQLECLIGLLQRAKERLTANRDQPIASHEKQG